MQLRSISILPGPGKSRTAGQSGTRTMLLAIKCCALILMTCTSALSARSTATGFVAGAPMHEAHAPRWSPRPTVSNSSHILTSNIWLSARTGAAQEQALRNQQCCTHRCIHGSELYMHAAVHCRAALTGFQAASPRGKAERLHWSGHLAAPFNACPRHCKHHLAWSRAAAT